MKEEHKHLDRQIDEVFDKIKPVGLGDLIARRMRESLEKVIEGTMAEFKPVLNEFEILEEEGE